MSVIGIGTQSQFGIVFGRNLVRYFKLSLSLGWKCGLWCALESVMDWSGCVASEFQCPISVPLSDSGAHNFFVTRAMVTMCELHSIR